MMGHDALSGWIPLYLQRGYVHWGYMGQERFIQPFCQDTLQTLARRPFNQLFRQRTGLDILSARADSHPGLPLHGIVFHMSRCGSTLTAQALAALADTVVLSEPPAIDTLLEWLVASPADDRKTSDALLKGLVAALGQSRREQDRRLFIKADAWHIGHINRILNAFPTVPWIFLYRNPVEVLVSHSRIPALYLIPGSLVQHGLKPPAPLLNQTSEHGAWVLSQILQAAIAAIQQHPNGLLINYSELPNVIETRLNQHFNLNLTTDDLSALRLATLRDAKIPNQYFETDSTEKLASADESLQAIAARWLTGPYNELEQLRTQFA
jgi:hypothetical protein